MNGLALCAGAGGLEFGIDLAVPGYRGVCYVEWEGYAASSLVARMEEQTLGEAPVWDDVTTFDGSPWRGVVDIVSAGFPCQPFSVAGKQRGTEDERWLWPDIERVIREVQPRWVVLENVPGLVRHGLGPVLGGLAALGYDAEWDLFSAGAVGAPHRRERFFLLARRVPDPERDPVRDEPERGPGSAQAANGGDSEPGDVGEGELEHPGSDGTRQSSTEDASPRAGGRDPARREPPPPSSPLADAEGRGFGVERRQEEPGRGGADVAVPRRERLEGIEPAWPEARAARRGSGAALADADSLRCERRGEQEHGNEQGARGGQSDRRGSDGGQHGPTGLGPPLFPPGPDDLELWARVLAETPEVEPSVCRDAHGMADWLEYRTDRLRTLGNGVVPLQAAYAVRALAARAGWELT